MVSKHFRKQILDYLEDRASTDSLFAQVYKKESKNIDDCCIYIMNVAQKLAKDSFKSDSCGSVGLTSDEVFGLAVHYYDEDSIEVGKPILNCAVVVNRTVELTQEELSQAKEVAFRQCISDEYKRLHSTPEKPKKVEKEVSTQLSFF